MFSFVLLEIKEALPAKIQRVWNWANHLKCAPEFKRQFEVCSILNITSMWWSGLYPEWYRWLTDSYPREACHMKWAWGSVQVEIIDFLIVSCYLEVNFKSTVSEQQWSCNQRQAHKKKWKLAKVWFHDAKSGTDVNMWFSVEPAGTRGKFNYILSMILLST